MRAQVFSADVLHKSFLLRARGRASRWHLLACASGRPVCAPAAAEDRDERDALAESLEYALPEYLQRERDEAELTFSKEYELSQGAQAESGCESYRCIHARQHQNPAFCCRRPAA